MRWLALAILVVGCSSKNEIPVHQEPTLDALPETSETGVADPELSAGDRAKLDAYLEQELKSHAWPNLAAGVVYGDTLVYEKGFGVDAHTTFRIGSITKVMTGVTVLQRRDREELDLDDPVAKHLPELATALPGVTIRHLVTHTSGIPSVGDGSAEYWTGDHDLTEAEVFTAIKNSKLEFTPGTKVAYSNFAVALAGIIAARKAGETYRDMIEGALFQPLAMSESTWDKPTDKTAKGFDLTATGYKTGGPHWRLGAAEPAGGLYSTIADMARFLSFESRAESTLDGFDAILSRASLRESMTKGSIGNFGVNWAIGDDTIGKWVWHNGSIGSARR